MVLYNWSIYIYLLIIIIEKCKDCVMIYNDHVPWVIMNGMWSIKNLLVLFAINECLNAYIIIYLKRK